MRVGSTLFVGCSIVADLQSIYRIAIRDSGGEEKWTRLSQAERSNAMDIVRRRVDLGEAASRFEAGHSTELQEVDERPQPPGTSLVSTAG